MSDEARDPVAALSRSIFGTVGLFTTDEEYRHIIERLTEQGYVLVNAEGLRRGLLDQEPHTCSDDMSTCAAVILAAIQEQDR